MRLPFLSKSKNKNQPRAHASSSVSSSSYSVKLKEAAALMEQRACGQAITLLKDIDKENADTEVWLMRAALYAERGDDEKARQNFRYFVDALKGEDKARDCWIWTAGIDADSARLWSTAVPRKLAAARIGTDAGGLPTCEIIRKSEAATSAPVVFPGATAVYAALAHFAWAVRHGAVIVARLTQDILKGTPFADLEAAAARKTGARHIIVPADEEMACLSKLYDPCVRYAWLTRDPALVQKEPALQAALTSWTANAGVIISHVLSDALGRWSILMPRFAFLDPAAWPAHKREGGALRVLHFDDHEDFSGTIFVEEAISRLRGRGVAIELVKMKRGTAEDRKRAFARSDVFVDGLNSPGYSDEAVEAMASGVAVVANLESEFNCRVLRRYSFLDECPVRSATPETIDTVLGALAGAPDEASRLGLKGREYVARRHSLKAAEELFADMAACLEFDVDDRPSLTNIYHPRLQDVKKPVRKQP